MYTMLAAHGALHVQVTLEAFGKSIDYHQLQGLWRLQYTTALDVVRPGSH